MISLLSLKLSGLFGEIINFYDYLAEAMNKTDEESENLHEQFLGREIELGAFVQKYKRHRYAYHKKALMLLAAKTSTV